GPAASCPGPHKPGDRRRAEDRGEDGRQPRAEHARQDRRPHALGGRDVRDAPRTRVLIETSERFPNPPTTGSGGERPSPTRPRVFASGGTGRQSVASYP